MSNNKNSKKSMWLYIGCSAITIAVCVGILILSHMTVLHMKSDSVATLVYNQKNLIANAEYSKRVHNSQSDTTVQIEPDSLIDDSNKLSQENDSSETSIEDEMLDRNRYIVVTKDGDTVYLIKKGDTLSEISSMVCFSVDELAELNHIKDVNLIYEGSVLRIPEIKAE